MQRAAQDAERLRAALADRTLRPATRARLTHLERATASHREKLAAVLAPLTAAPSDTRIETHLALRTRLPPDQGLTTYYGNLHRDWAWGADENAASFEIVRARLTERPGRVLVLGAGGGRIAYDIHEGTAAAATTALDFNPLLVLAARRIAAGEPVELYEFPLAPRTPESAAVLRTLAAPQPARAGLRFVLADAQRAPFAAGAFDTVVTPWLVDILPERFDALAARVNRLLADGGRWINFGSLSFHTPEPAERYGLDECRAVLEETGFGNVETDEHELPYLSSPASRHARRERVVAWVATKERPAAQPPRYTALPDWLVRGTEPVPASDAFRTQAAATRIHAFLMTLIDGRRSIKDMAQLLEEQRLMGIDEAEDAIRTFLVKMYDDARRGASY
jgi:ubiquinone/menaquinone biosynthesis C-methylase UbiE